LRNDLTIAGVSEPVLSYCAACDMRENVYYLTTRKETFRKVYVYPQVRTALLSSRRVFPRLETLAYPLQRLGLTGAPPVPVISE
jgi:hypothetical protein